MEVMPRGPTFSIEVSEYGNDLQAMEKASSSSGFTVNDEENGICSSSIGSPGDSEEDNDEELGLQGLGSLSSLEDSLLTKRGLSNHYKGKSKSFGNLGEIGSVKEVPKQENALNKRRRLQICNKLARRSFYSWQNPKSMPLFPVNEDEEDNEDLKSGYDENKSTSSDEEREGVFTRKHSFKNRAVMSRSCFTLSDLQEEDDDDQ
ncbi:unnamed protein product [Eruca vesicaria subsp. sativa]|uniref:Uncharacterized protein n=1 Tax=Eruca vesicaria subsp. sativa TaxID=29727 RepID=A0ABC8K0E5_ERUVS|nr:unnamed protein product [Eruca vesicaria subsp. sativa]